MACYSLLFIAMSCYGLLCPITKICKIDCKLIEYIPNYYYKEQQNKFIRKQIEFLPSYLLQVKYMVKIDFLTYLSTLGGLLSMWMGYAIFDLFNLILKIILKYISMKKKIKNILKLFCLIIMIYQVYIFIYQYLNNNYELDYTKDKNKLFPKIAFGLLIFPDQSRILKLKPNFYDEDERKFLKVKNLPKNRTNLLNTNMKILDEIPREFFVGSLFRQSLSFLNQSLEDFLYSKVFEVFNSFPINCLITV